MLPPPTPTERRLLQIAVALGGCVPVGAGLLGVFQGAEMVPGNAPASLALDSHVRYLSGLLLGIGLTFWCFIPRVDEHGRAFRLLTIIVFIGGLARLCGLTAGTPPAPMLFGFAMELVVTPLLCIWQFRIARYHGHE